jgi:hypothetical protein
MNIFDMGFSGSEGIREGIGRPWAIGDRRRPDLPLKVDLAPTLTIERPHKTDW